MESSSITDKIREGAKLVTAETTHVKIREEALAAFAEKIDSLPSPAQDRGVVFWDGGPKTLMFYLLLGATNFCSWSERFVVEYQGKRYGEQDGCQAVAAAWKRAFEVGAPVTDADWLAHMGENEFTAIMRTEEGEPAMFTQRLFNVRELGRALKESYGGNVEGLISAGKGDTENLLRQLAQLEAFKDYRTWRGVSYPVMSRAQWLIADLVEGFQGRDYGRLVGLEALTAVAEHRLPQLLQSEGVLEYSPELLDMINRQEVMACESEEEYSIRAATIVAVDRLVELRSAKGAKESAISLSRRLRRYASATEFGVRHHRTYTASY